MRSDEDTEEYVFDEDGNKDIEYDGPESVVGLYSWRRIGIGVGTMMVSFLLSAILLPISWALWIGMGIGMLVFVGLFWRAGDGVFA